MVWMEKMQKNLGLKISLSILASMLAVSFVSCASTNGSQGVDMGKLLNSAGFKKAVADTPEKLDHLKKLPQRKVVPHHEGDKIFYIYADVEKCKCAYAGDEEAYKRYQKLTQKSDLAEQDRREGARDQQRQMDWGDSSFSQDW
jgi:hypothetical protein